MKLPVITICCIVGLSNCNPCDKYNSEIYKETFERQFDSMGMKRKNFFLKKYEEPELEKLEYESYRLVFGHVFSDTSHIIRIGNKNSNYFFIHKILVSDSDSTRAVTEKIEKTLLPQDWKNFKAVIYENGFWTLPKEIDRQGLDGSQWTIEGRRPDAENCGKRGYHLVSRWSPEEGGFSQLCDKFIEIMEVKESEK